MGTSGRGGPFVLYNVWWSHNQPSSYTVFVQRHQPALTHSHRRYTFASPCLVSSDFIYLVPQALRAQPECISASNSSSSSNPDHVRDLNNFLQGFKDADGNFTRYLSWLMKHDGPDNQKTHYATARCEHFYHPDN